MIQFKHFNTLLLYQANKIKSENMLNIISYFVK